MQQYLDLLRAIKEKGTHKPAAREGMPGTTSLFGYQFRHNLADGFPLLTTKEINFGHIIIELLWFLRGDTNIKFLVDHGVNIWNEDAFNFYEKKCKENNVEDKLSYKDFVTAIKGNSVLIYEENIYTKNLPLDYKIGDCGFQYGRVWRNWDGIARDVISIKSDNLTIEQVEEFRKKWNKAVGGVGSHAPIVISNELDPYTIHKRVDQIAKVLKSLSNNPESRRHLVTAIDPAHDEELALYWCHCLVQFNCRPLTFEEKIQWVMRNTNVELENLAITEEAFSDKTPNYYLDCQLYQRSADSFLGVPYNIASYALLTHLFCKILNMIPGDFIHTFGDVHIYDNHMEQVNLQLSREPKPLTELFINDEFWNSEGTLGNNVDAFLKNLEDDNFIYSLINEEIMLTNYSPYPGIKAKLSTGLK